MGPPQPTAEHVLSAVVHASGISLDTLLGRRSRHEIVRVRAIAAVILRSEAGLTAKEAGSTLRRSRQSVHNLIAKAAPGGDPAAAELVTQVREALYPALLSVSARVDRRWSIGVLDAGRSKSRSVTRLPSLPFRLRSPLAG